MLITRDIGEEEVDESMSITRDIGEEEGWEREGLICQGG